LITGTKEQHDPPVCIHLGQQVDRFAVKVNPVYVLGDVEGSLIGAHRGAVVRCDQPRGGLDILQTGHRMLGWRCDWQRSNT